MPNLKPATPILPQVITPGENHVIAFHVHDADSGHNFNWSGYTPVAKITVGTTVITGTCVVTNQGGGTATATFTAAQTGSLAHPAWGALVIYADPTSGSENLGIAVVEVRTEGVAIP
jgi:hypothetical protein